MEIVRDQTIADQTVTLDHTKFINCHFEDCTLEYAGGPVVLVDTRMTDCVYNFIGPALHTIEFLQNAGLLENDPARWSRTSRRAN